MLKAPNEWQVNWPVLSKYLGTEGNRYGKYLKIELPDYTFLLLYHYYTILLSTSRILGCLVEHCPKCLNIVPKSKIV